MTAVLYWKIIENMNYLEKIFKGLANKRRLLIIRILTKEKELPVAEIARRIKISLTSTSKHLNMLRQLDIVDCRQESLTVFYRLSDTVPLPVKQVLGTISNSRE